MASDPMMIEPPSMPDSEWDEAKILSSLARLQEMHIRLRNLRQVIPQIIDTLLLRHSSPQDLYSSFAQNVRRSAGHIKDFSSFMEDDQTQQILERARESRTRNPEGVKGWLVTEHKDWLDKREDRQVDSQTQMVTPHTDIATSGEDNVSLLLQRFGARHKDVAVSMDNETSKTIKIYLPKPADIAFDIEPVLENRDGTKYNVTTRAKSKMHVEMVDAICTRPQPNNLENLLEMLASYMDLKSRPCDKCGRLLDRNAQFPVSRRMDIKHVDPKVDMPRWLALHKDCK